MYIDIAIARYDTAHVALGLLQKMGVNYLKTGFFKGITLGNGPFTDIKTLSQELKRELRLEKCQNYEGIILVGHSMGGLIGIRYILEEIENNSESNILGFISLATPFNGSNKAFYNSLIKSIHKHAQIPSLEPNSTFLDDTIRLWKKHYEKIGVQCAFCFGIHDEWVSQESAIPHVVSSKWADSTPLPGTHSGILDIVDHNSTSYAVVSDFILKFLKKEQEISNVQKELDEYEIRVKARCIARWQATGISKEKASMLLEKCLENEYYLSFLPNPNKPISVLVGEFGIGKSLIADIIFLKSIGNAKVNKDNPFPIYFKASSELINLHGSIEKVVSNLKEIKDRSLSIIIDGADEIDSSIVSQLITEARIWVEVFKGSTVTIMSRPLQILNIEEKTNIPIMAEVEAYELIGNISNVEVTLGMAASWPDNVKNAVRRPLFAILLGIYLMDQDMRIPKSKGELLSHLVEKSLVNAGGNIEKHKVILNRLAILSTERGYSSVPISEVSDGEELYKLIETRMIAFENGCLFFPLPILTQWFAAQALAQGMKDINEIVIDAKILEYWRYPLVILVSAFNYNIIEEKFSVIVKRNIGLAAVIVNDGLAGWGLSNEILPPPSIECGKMIRNSMSSWVKGLGKIANLIAPLDAEGEIRALGVRTADSTLIASWYNGVEKIDSVVLFDEKSSVIRRYSRDWPSLRMARPGRQSGWALRWTLDELSNNLSKILQNRAIPVSSGPMFIELMWKTALAFKNKGSLFTGDIPLEEFNDLLNSEMKSFEHVYFNYSNNAYNLKKFCEYILDLKSKGENYLRCPWPGDDREPLDGSNNVWDYYTDEQLLNRTRKVYAEAITAYTQVVNEWFESFKCRLHTWVVLPACLKGKLIIPDKIGKDFSGPYLYWYFEAISSEKTSYVDISLAKNYNHSNDFSELSALYEKLRQLRYTSAEWVSAIQHVECPEVFRADPVTEIVYKWLWEDLKKISWVNGNLGYKV